MNYTFPLHPLHSSDELLYQISQDMLQVIPPRLGTLDLPINQDKSRMENNNGWCINENKKIIHREMERQRRQEMATLYSSLGSVLPLEFLKGKQSIPDQIDKAVNYIKFLKKKIKELGDKRDQLKRMSNSNTYDIVTESLCSDFVMVQPCQLGVEVVISSSLRDGVVVPLSRVLEVMVEGGLGVVNCVSTKVNACSFFNIQSEVNNSASLDASALQQKLLDLVVSYKSDSIVTSSSIGLLAVLEQEMASL